MNSSTIYRLSAQGRKAYPRTVSGLTIGGDDRQQLMRAARSIYRTNRRFTNVNNSRAATIAWVVCDAAGIAFDITTTPR